MDIKTEAEALWTQLVMSMRQDGMIPEELTQAGPATANVLVNILLNPKKTGAGWFSENIKPKDNTTQVWALLDDGEYRLVRWSGSDRAWMLGGGMVPVLQAVVSWTFLPKVQS